jgi:glycosyltransferase involved in cell wall biosynthesis
MTSGRLAGLHALVVTPFLPLPADAGQRKRVLQFHELLRGEGCRITLLHYAVEQPFGWAHHDGIDRAVQALMDETITVHAGPSFGRAPLADGLHRLDEWWDPVLADTVQRLFAKRWFDIVVVNNVWLTKVFDHVAPGCVKVLESHDVFSERVDALRAIGAQADFFVCNRSDETFGWSRADVVVAISDREQVSIAGSVEGASVVALPYAEAMSAPRRRGYVHPEKVVFGFFGSAHPFNVHGVKALIAQLSTLSRWAPIELVVAGEVGRSLTPDEAAMVTDLGYVQSPDDFYDAIDIFVSPLDYGSGLKIKVVEAISKGVPTLVTEHSAIGTCMDRQLVVPDVAVLAAAMSRIAQNRPDLETFADALGESQRNLAEAVEDGSTQLVGLVGGYQHRAVLRYDELSLPTSDPRLWVLVGMVRELANRGPVVLDLGDGAAEPSWLRYMHPRVQLAGPAAEAGVRGGHGDSRARVSRERLASGLNYQVVLTNEPGYRLTRAALHVHDARWRPADETPPQATHVLAIDGKLRHVDGVQAPTSLPWWSDSIIWDPILPKFRKPRGEPWIAVVAPRSTSPSLGALASLASHAAALPARLFDIDGASIPVDLLAELRADPPVFVLEFAWPSDDGIIGAWCRSAAIPYACTLAASEALALVRQPSPAAENARIVDWTDALDALYVTS